MDGIRYWIETEGTGHWFYVAFPAVLICLFIWFKGRRVRFLIPSFIISLVIINPWFYRKWDELGLYAYWRILWVVPAIPVIAGLVPSITERIQKGWIKTVVAAAGIGLVVIGGTFLYNGAGGSFVEAANVSKLPDYVVAIADRLLELDDNPRVIAQDPIGVYLRQYSGQINSLFGRDIDGYILYPDGTKQATSAALNNPESDLTAVRQLILDDEYEYLVIKERDTAEGLYLVDRIGEYCIYKTIQQPMVVKRRNELGQIISITEINDSGDPVNNNEGFTTIHYRYDKDRNITYEFRTNTDGAGVADSDGIAGYEREYDADKHITRELILDAEGEPVMGPLGYAEVRRSYQGNSIEYEEYYDINGNPVMNTMGYASFKTSYEANGNPATRAYLDITGEIVNRKDGYSSVSWETDENKSIHLYDDRNTEVSIDGINIVRDIEYGPDGWSEWYIPAYYFPNNRVVLGTVNLGNAKAGDNYCCHIEIEFEGVQATPDMQFIFWSQGSADGKWDIGNVWDSNLINLDKPPQDGVYTYTVTNTVNENMVGISSFNIELRCGNWSRGKFRVRGIMIQKGDVSASWSPGL